MTATATMAPNDSWTEQLEQLKARYKHVRQPVLVALNILLHDENVSLDDAKAQARMHGVRITAASVNAAKTLRAKMDAEHIAKETNARTAQAPRVPELPEPRRVRRPRAPDKAIDAEAMIRNVVAKLQGQGNAEADRLRDAMRKAIAALQAAIG